MTRPFSHSSLSTFERCPAKYKFSYVDGIRKPHEGVEAFLGRRVHESLEFLYREIGQGRVPLFDSILDHYTEQWYAKWHDDVVIVKKRFSSDHYFKVGVNCLGRFYRQHYPFSHRVKEVEYTLVFKLDPEDDFLMKGIVDRLDHVGNGRWEIHDYKTSSRPMSQTDADRNRQLALYQIGLSHLFDGVEKVELVWHFLRQGIEVRSIRTDRQLLNLKKKIRTLVSAIRQSVENKGPFPPKESILCNWCFYWEECPAKGGHNPFVKSEATS